MTEDQLSSFARSADKRQLVQLKLDSLDWSELFQRAQRRAADKAPEWMLKPLALSTKTHPPYEPLSLNRHLHRVHRELKTIRLCLVGVVGFSVGLLLTLLIGGN